MGIVKDLQALTEDISKSALDQLEKILDKLYAKVGIDIEFTKHFLDRLNDERNKKPISLQELISIYDEAYRKHGKKISDIPTSVEAVLKDIESNINIPFALKHNKRSGKIELIGKTVMRKQNFKTSNRVLEV